MGNYGKSVSWDESEAKYSVVFTNSEKTPGIFAEHKIEQLENELDLETAPPEFKATDINLSF